MGKMDQIVVAAEGIGLDPVGGFENMDEAEAFAARWIADLRSRHGSNPRTWFIHFEDVAVVVCNSWSAPEQREYLRLPYFAA